MDGQDNSKHKTGLCIQLKESFPLLWSTGNFYTEYTMFYQNSHSFVRVSPGSTSLKFIILLGEQLQQFSVACCLCQLQRRDSIFVWQIDSHQTPRLAKQQLCKSTHTPSNSQVEGRLSGTVLWRIGRKIYYNFKK